MVYIGSESRVRVKKVILEGPGVVILTGPSSCGKGEVAAALCEVMSIDASLHLSMGEILRNAFRKANTEPSYAKLLADKYNISGSVNIFESVDANEDLNRKVRNYVPQMEAYFKKTGMAQHTTQLEWLEFCTMQGLLVPNRWTQEFIAAHIEHTPALRHEPFILDGYPRTVAAAQHLLDVLRRTNVPVIKVLHLSISKQEMLTRAGIRGRADDDVQSLLSRFNFYIENVQPSVDYMKMELGSDAIALVDAHQPVYKEVGKEKKLDLQASIANVVSASLRSLGVPRVIVRDIIEMRGRGEFKRQ